MKNAKLLKILFFSFLLTISFSSVKAQENPPNDIPNQGQPIKARPNLLRELGLTPEQMKAIRRLNAEKKADVQEAQRKAAEARRNLDIAIYSDNTDDAEVKMRLEEFQNAQMEVIKIRSTVEYEIRKLLTPEQVVRFRQLRQRFAEVRENMRERRQNNQQNQRPLPQNRFNNRQRLNPKN
ncbi:MAG: Spy/CpxP family protein refolding chaperone [Pyrinomonadaceae bacterium]|nr:Spy/CpxP family protein refolding chaperone [Pyrinomonadaceae bacterium]